MTEKDIRRLAAESLVDVRTVKKFLGGGRVWPLNEERIRAAAKKLKLRLN